MIERYHFSTIDSTNDYAKRSLPQLKKEVITLITAETQSAGHGRQGRPWKSVKGNLYATYVYYTHKDIDQASLVQLLAKIIQRVLSEYGIESSIKWPNDLLVNGKKICGILIEVTNDWIIMGFGLNVNLGKEELLQINQPATSMSIELGKELNEGEVLENITSYLLANTNLRQ